MKNNNSASYFSETKNTVSEEHWIENIRQGDKTVFEIMFRTYYPGLCTFVYHYVKSTDVAEELVQNIFMNIWVGHKKWKPRGTIKSYLYKAAKNKALNYLKHERIKQKFRKHKATLEREVVLSPEDEFQQNEFAAAVHRAIDELPEKCRIIFNLSRQNEMTYAEIAKSLNISIKTVETQMGRALKNLRKILAPFLQIF